MSTQQQLCPGGAPTVDEIEVFVDAVFEQLRLMQLGYPGRGYAARLYSCESCQTFSALIGPVLELVDGRACPGCERPQQAIAPASSRAPRPTSRRSRRPRPRRRR